MNVDVYIPEHCIQLYVVNAAIKDSLHGLSVNNQPQPFVPYVLTLKSTLAPSC
jgi:hypothetical protein